MGLLKRVLYVQAAIWAVVGIGLALVPWFVVRTLFSQYLSSYGWVRIAGVQLLGFTLFSVLIAQSIEDRWWWSWAFVVVNAAVATIAVLTAALTKAHGTTFSVPSNVLSNFPVAPGSSRLLWWVIAGTEAVITGFLLWGMAKAGTEQPPDLRPPDD